MNIWKAVRNGATIAACVMALRFVLAFAFHWPAYSWPEMGCLFLFAQTFRLGESSFIHILAPTVCYALAGGIVGGIIWSIPHVSQLRPPVLWTMMAALLSCLILVPIILFQLSGWL